MSRMGKFNNTFWCFAPALDLLCARGPLAVFVIGSLSDSVTHDTLSDVDCLFVWSNDQYAGIVEEVLHGLRECTSFTTGYFGPHIQFGHLICLRDTLDFSISFDIGLMSDLFYRDFLPPTHKTPISRHKELCKNPVQPEKRIYLFFHTLAQCVKACYRSKLIYASDYLCRARTLLLLILCQPDDADGMRRSTFKPEMESELLHTLDTIPIRKEDILTGVRILIEEAERMVPGSDALAESFIHAFEKYGL